QVLVAGYPSGHQAQLSSPLRGEGQGEGRTRKKKSQQINEANALISTRILARRRLGATGATPRLTAAPRRRRRTRGFVQVAGTVAAERLHVSTFGHAYVGLGAVVIAILFYLAVAAQITQ